MNDPISLIPEDRFTKHQDGKFAPKLSEDERCAILALVKSGIRRDVVAATFDVNKRTVSSIVSHNSTNYAGVRAKYNDEGHDAFVAKYVTEDIARRVANANAPASVKPVPKADGVSWRANKLAGVHKIAPMPGLRGTAHGVEIRYIRGDDAAAGDGWYYRHLTSKTDKDSWLHFGDESRKTSSACLQAVNENLFDT